MFRHGGESSLFSAALPRLAWIWLLALAVAVGVALAVGFTVAHSGFTLARSHGGTLNPRQEQALNLVWQPVTSKSRLAQQPRQYRSSTSPADLSLL